MFEHGLTSAPKVYKHCLGEEPTQQLVRRAIESLNESGREILAWKPLKIAQKKGHFEIAPEQLLVTAEMHGLRIIHTSGFIEKNLLSNKSWISARSWIPFWT